MFLDILLTYFSGVIAGFINLLAGGGSLLTLPLLIIMLGMEPATANGTNRLALLCGSLVGIKKFKDQGFFHLKLGLLTAIPSVFGAVIGSYYSLSISGESFKKILGIVMLLVLIFILKGNHPVHSHHVDSPSRAKQILTAFIFLLIGFYGGFIQVGIGFIIMLSLQLLFETSLARINSLKAFIVSFYMVFSVIIFIINQKIHWSYGFLLALGNATGSWLGAHLAVKKGDKWIKAVLCLAVPALSAKLLGLF